MTAFVKFTLFGLVYLLTHPVAFSQQDTIIPEKEVGKLLDTGGWKMHYNYVISTNKNSPTIIFESGIRGFSFEWTPIQQKLIPIANS